MPTNEPKTRKRIITIRHETPSRRRIVIIVAQMQNAMGEWLVPIITFEGPMMPISESVDLARDVGIALLVASWIHDEMMLAVKNSEFANNETNLIIEEDE